MSGHCATLIEVTLVSKLVVVTSVMEVRLAKISIVGIKILIDRRKTIFRSCICSAPLLILLLVTLGKV